MANIIYNLLAMGWGKPGELAQPVAQDSPLPVGGKKESFQLAAANVAAAQVTVYGGDYIFAQLATGYGTIKLQVLGPDGATWLDLVSKTASDASGAGTGIALPNDAQVRATLTGTTLASATLRRVP